MKVEGTMEEAVMKRVKKITTLSDNNSVNGCDANSLPQAGCFVLVGKIWYCKDRCGGRAGLPAYLF
jgi:hypothetical protein